MASAPPAGSVPTHTPRQRLQQARCVASINRRRMAERCECPPDDTPSGQEWDDNECRTNWLVRKLAQTLSDDCVGVFDAQLENVRI